MNVKSSVKTELCKLSDAIESTKKLAMQSPNGFDYGARYVNDGFKAGVEYSFEEGWAVANCGEVWGAREAILDGATFDELTFQSINAKTGKIRDLCKNCQVTFKGHY